MADASFIPHCLRCGYDLSHIPEGTCPECGEPYLLANLKEAWYARRVVRIDPSWVLVACIAISLLSFPDVGNSFLRSVRRDETNNVWCVAVWGLALLWMLVDRARVFRGAGLAVLWLAFPLVHIMTTQGFANSRVESFEPGLVMVTGAAVAGIAWMLTHKRRPAPLLALLGMLFLAPGVLFGPIWRINNWWWTPFIDPRAHTAQVYSQYPLTRDEIAPVA